MKMLSLMAEFALIASESPQRNRGYMNIVWWIVKSVTFN